MNRLQHINAVPLEGGNGISLQFLNPSPGEYSGVRLVRREKTHPVSPGDGVLAGDVNNQLLFSLDGSFAHHLDNAVISTALAARFAPLLIAFSPRAVVQVIAPGLKWAITDGGTITDGTITDGTITDGTITDGTITDGQAVYLLVNNSGEIQVYGLSRLEDRGADDTGLQAETVYYYTLFPYKTHPPDPQDPSMFDFDPRNRATAMVCGNYGFARTMYRLLPAVYHRYDRMLNPSGDDGSGPLYRFLEITGSVLDQLYSYTAAARNLRHIDAVDGRLLPMMARWIGWETDFSKEVEKQRIQLRNAPTLYKSIGSVPTLETMIKQVTDWKNKVKEFMHVIFFTNRPEQLYPSISSRTGSNWQSGELLSVDYSFDGRPAAVWSDSVLWLFFHSPRKGNWDIRFKTYTSDEGWTPSLPFTPIRSGDIDKHPSAVLRETAAEKELWVFWTAYHPDTHEPHIRYRVQTLGLWSEDMVFDHGGGGDLKPRRNPVAAVDGNQRLWLFWFEDEVPGTGLNRSPRTRLKYNCLDGETWISETSIEFPLDGVLEPQVGTDLFVLVHPFSETDEDNRLTLFWSRKRPVSGGTGLMRYLSGSEVVWRQKTGLIDPTAGWGEVRVLPKPSGAWTLSDVAEDIYDDKEPAAVINKDGNVELFWSSNRSGNWTVETRTIADLSAPGLSVATVVADNRYSQRTPLPLYLDEPGNEPGESVTLIHRSSRGPAGLASGGGKLETLDFRSAGSVGIDDRSRLRLGQQTNYTDFINYTYDTSQGSGDTRYTRDTVGLFLSPTHEDIHLINRNQEIIKGILDRFVPIFTRIIFIIQPPDRFDYVYPYVSEGVERDLEDGFRDSLAESFPAEVYPAEIGDSVDKAGIDWVWLESWSDAYPAHQTVDSRSVPVNTRYRSVHTEVDPQEEEGMVARSLPEIYPGFTESISDSVDYSRMGSWSESQTDRLTVDTGTLPVFKNHRTLHAGLVMQD